MIIHRFVYTVCFLGALGLILPTFAPAKAKKEASEGPTTVQWVEPNKAVEEAKRLNKPILYDFMADWCGPCHRLARELFGHKKTAQFINQHFVPVKVRDRRREEGRNAPLIENLQIKYRIRAFPTLVCVSPDLGKTEVLEGYNYREVLVGRFESFLKKLK